MRTDRRKLPDSVRTHFATLGYSYQNEEHPEFGGIVIYLQKGDGEQEAAYYISKPSTIELVTSDELRNALDYLSDIPLRHAVTTSQFSHGFHELAAEYLITLWEPQTEYVEIEQPLSGNALGKRQPLQNNGTLAASAGRTE
jgi:hypothetical protein